MITSGEPFGAKAAHEMGIVDELVEEGKLREGAHRLRAARSSRTDVPLRKVRDLNDKIEAARGHPEIFDELPQGERPQVPRLRGPEDGDPRRRGRRRPAVRRGHEASSARCS